MIGRTQRKRIEAAGHNRDSIPIPTKRVAALQRPPHEHSGRIGNQYLEGGTQHHSPKCIKAGGQGDGRQLSFIAHLRHRECDECSSEGAGRVASRMVVQ